MVFIISFTMLGSAAAFCLARFLAGPTLADRIVAADSMGLMMAMILVLVTMYLRSQLLLDILVVYSVLLFADLLVFSKLFEKGDLHI